MVSIKRARLRSFSLSDKPREELITLSVLAKIKNMRKTTVLIVRN